MSDLGRQSSFLLQRPKAPENASVCAFGGFYVILFGCSAYPYSAALKVLHVSIRLALYTDKVSSSRGQLFWEDRAAYRDEMFWTHALPGDLSRLHRVSPAYPPFPGILKYVISSRKPFGGRGSRQNRAQAHPFPRRSGNKVFNQFFYKKIAGAGQCPAYHEKETHHTEKLKYGNLTQENPWKLCEICRMALHILPAVW